MTSGLKVAIVLTVISLVRSDVIKCDGGVMIDCSHLDYHLIGGIVSG